MIPFRDNIPSRSFPIITVSIIIANVCVFFYELSLGSRSFERFIMHYGVVPTTILAWPQSHVPFTAVALPFFTSIFLHAGWLHLIGNMWYLWIFGDNIEDRLGHFAYLIFYLVCGLGAGIVHTVMNSQTTVPASERAGLSRAFWARIWCRSLLHGFSRSYRFLSFCRSLKFRRCSSSSFGS